jgi:hypothetical protein
VLDYTKGVQLDEIIQRLRLLQPALADRFGVSQLWIFGSRARGDNQLDSDLDVLVEFDRRGITLFGFAGLELAIEDVLGIPTQLVERGALRADFAVAVLRDAVAV